jgi:hypothetical protein
MISPDAIRNEQGQVLMVWTLNRPPKQVLIDGTDRVYVFSYNFNVCASWVDEQDVERMLKVREKTCNCNNGNYRQAFEYANRLNANLWIYGNREGKVYQKENV